MPKIIKKKILTEDDLFKFCQEQKFAKFSSKDTGYQLALKVPTTFEVDNTVDENHRGMMRLKFRIFHTGLNRNKSYVSKESAEKAMNTIADRPVLAAIHQLDDGSWDFEGHEMEIIKDDKGNEEPRYIESQVGSFSSEPAFWEHDEKLDKDYVCAYAYISEEYTKACDIIRAKQGSKNSCELFIDELSYNAKEKYLELNDFYVNASTLLGSHDDGAEIQEGMEGSRADIVDFSVENNSVKFDKDEKMIELLENLNKTLSNFNREQTSVQTQSKKGGIEVEKEKFEEEVTKTVEVTETEETTEEEVTVTENESEETVDETSEETTENTEEDPVENTQDETTDTGVTENESVNPEKYSVTMSDGSVKEFSLSLDEITMSLYNLVNQMYGEADNAYYGVTVYEDNTLIMSDYWNGKYYRQSFNRDGDNFSLVGDRVAVHSVWVTDEEDASLNEMRSNYSSVVEELNTYKSAEVFADKMTVFDDEAYSEYLDTDEFKALMSEDSVNKYSKEELSEKADATLGKLVKKNKTFSFAGETPQKKHVSRVAFNAEKETEDTYKPYGDLFD